MFRRESQDVFVGKFNLITTVAFHFQAVGKAKALIEADNNRSMYLTQVQIKRYEIYALVSSDSAHPFPRANPRTLASFGNKLANVLRPVSSQRVEQKPGKGVYFCRPRDRDKRAVQMPHGTVRKDVDFFLSGLTLFLFRFRNNRIHGISISKRTQIPMAEVA